MTPERWERVHEALQGSLDRDPADRRRFLRELGRRDPAVHGEVASLLATGLARGPFDALAERFVTPRDPGDTLPSRIGPYEPVRLLGRGGMGSVYVARRADGAFEQEVAIKVLAAGTGADLHSRFLAERRILARLRHPHIARLFDGGATRDGLPYLVMEYVEGEPLTVYCDRHGLDVDARLRLFLDVCAAVSYAHANLVVHRDLKPANVLVSPGEGSAGHPARVKLLDFGIAKLLDPGPTFGAAPATRAGLRLMTPEYAAPEQVRGEPVTTATDVYQLGVLAYELLCGRTPHRLPTRRLHDLERVICRGEPRKPSAAVAGDREDGDNGDDLALSRRRAIAHARGTTLDRLRRRLAGDLDTIVLHALAPEPDRRYGSVDALADDLRRHLGGLPVRARPDTWHYRARKFARRNRAATLTATGVALVLAASGISLALQNRRIASERDRAEQAVAVLTELVGDLEPALARGATIPTRVVLDRARERARSALAGQPLLQARVFDGLGRTYQLRGHYADAEPLLREALALRLASLAPDHLEVAESRYAVAGLLLEAGRPGEAEPLLSSAAETVRRRLGPGHPRLALIRIDHALARRAAGDGGAAEALLGEALEILRREPSAPREDLATALVYLGKVRLERGDLEGAEAPLREALAARRELYGEDHPTVANALDGFGELMYARGDATSAEARYREALSIRRRLFPASHVNLGISYQNLGIALRGQGRNTEAGDYLRDALAILRPAFGDAHPDVRATAAHLDSLRVTMGRPAAKRR